MLRDARMAATADRIAAFRSGGQGPQRADDVDLRARALAMHAAPPQVGIEPILLKNSSLIAA